MKLYHNAASPFVRKVHLLLIESGQEDSVELVASGGSPMDSSNMPVAENPLGKIPALERTDGPALYDSRVICQYLDALAGGGFYPEARKWEAMVLEATADGIMDAAVLMVYEGRCRPEEMVYDAWVEAQWDKVSRALDAIEARWLSHLHGPMDMGHLATAAALGYLDFRHEARDWRAGRPSLAAWFGTFSERDSFQRSAPS